MTISLEAFPKSQQTISVPLRNKVFGNLFKSIADSMVARLERGIITEPIARPRGFWRYDVECVGCLGTSRLDFRFSFSSIS